MQAPTRTLGSGSPMFGKRAADRLPYWAPMMREAEDRAVLTIFTETGAVPPTRAGRGC